MFLPFQKPQNPEPIELKPSDSLVLKRYQNLNSWQFRSLFFAIGITASNFVRPNPSYFWFYVCGVILGGLALMFFPPTDSSYQSLWRTAGISLYVGAVLAWWDLLKLLQWWHFVGVVVIAILGLFAIGLGGRR
ncbi:MAG: hypothetical protein QQW96_03705 [Tychonema bourrellyi B0820]|nr:hypothetical protein [Tychonema bourrellyi B0820]PJE45252.1 MAG: hypothetical protein CUR32_01230 [Flavobacterium sp.] [Flavobacterium sp. FEMGT703F]